MSTPPARLGAALADRYRFEREIGRGSMAIVYLARDLRHDRDVAIKVLMPELAAILGAERFLFEITTTAALQHPHILPLFDSGEADGFLYYVMPYIDGGTLRAKLDRETQLGVEDAVRITTEVADALQYAHEHGVIHRDVKPENILLQDGRPMVADFGIALAVRAAAGGRKTETGLTLGTPHYMSPEQATADKEITGRSDVFSLASVLYEMLAGQPPHLGGSAQQIIMKIVTDTPRPVTELRKNVPPHVAAALATALERFPADRFASARAFAIALGDRAYGTTGLTVPQGAGTALVGWRSIAAVLAVGVLAVLAGFLVGNARAVADGNAGAPATFSTLGPSPDEEWVLAGPFLGFAIAPEGRRVAIGVRRRSGNGVGLSDNSSMVDAIMIRSLDSLGGQYLPNTEGATFPFWSPKGDSLGYFRDGHLVVLELSSGASRSLCPVASPEGGSWGRNGVILYASTGSGMRRTTATESDCAPFGIGISESRQPQFLGDGVHFVVLSKGSDDRWGTLLGSIDEDSLTLLVEYDGAPAQPVVGLPDRLIYTLPGGEDGYYHAQRIDLANRRLVGPAVPLLRNISAALSRTPISTASDGSMVVVIPPTAKSRAGRLMAGALRDSVTMPSGVFFAPRVANGGRRVIVGGFRLSIWDSERGVWDDLLPQRSAREVTTYPVWSARDTAVAFVRQLRTIAVMSLSDRTSRVVFADSTNRRVRKLEWSRDGRWLGFVRSEGDAAPDAEAWVADLTTGETRQMFEDAGSVIDLSFSPDGRQVAYERDAAGGSAIFVRPFAGPGPAVRVLGGEGHAPRWGSDGRSLFFQRAGEVVRTRVNASGAAIGTPEIVVSKAQVEQLLPGYGSYFFDVAPRTDDVFIFPSSGQGKSLTLVQHWPAMMRPLP